MTTPHSAGSTDNEDFQETLPMAWISSRPVEVAPAGHADLIAPSVRGPREGRNGIGKAAVALQAAPERGRSYAEMIARDAILWRKLAE